MLGYPIETVLAEKITTAITLGAANTRVRDYADLYTLTGQHVVAHKTAREALIATAAFRGVDLAALSEAIDDLIELRRTTYTAYRRALGRAGMHLPVTFSETVIAVTAFADRLVRPAPPNTHWLPTIRGWDD